MGISETNDLAASRIAKGAEDPENSSHDENGCVPKRSHNGSLPGPQEPTGMYQADGAPQNWFVNHPASPSSQ